MANEELLLAISEMMDKKLAANLKPIENRLDRIEEHLDLIDVRLDRVEERLDKVEERLDHVEEKVNKIEGRVKRVESKVVKIEVDLLENNVVPRLNTIEACYTSTYQRYQDHADQMDSVYENIKLLNQTVIKHSQILKKIS
ncbi:MAG: hypothetical protein OSJ72_09860 [Lachnospiraceae bacterium]|nr:hypothetical protein [Lachnospiraceae bacterium]